MQIKHILSALLVVVLAVGGTIYTISSNNEPLLGIDLQGGVSVVLRPTEPAEDEQLDQVVEIIRSRVDSVGVAEPEISKQGGNVIVALPGLVSDQQQTIDDISQSAELQFRPVIGQVFIDDGSELSLSPIEGDPATDEGEQTDDDEEGSDEESEEDSDEDSEEAGSLTDTTEATIAESVQEEETSTTEGDEEASGANNIVNIGSTGNQLAQISPIFALQDDTTTDTVDEELSDVESDDETQPAFTEEDLALLQEQAAQSSINENCPTEVTAKEDDDPQDYIVLPEGATITQDGELALEYSCLGPVVVRGEALEEADSGPNPDDLGRTYLVTLEFKNNEESFGAYNAAAFECFNRTEECPSQRLAAVLDHQVITAPNINAPRFTDNVVQITGNFDKDGARNLAQQLNFGALPVELVADNANIVSATVGQDVLDAGVMAGIVGLGLVALYLLAMYRLSGLVAILGIAFSAMLLWTIISWLGETQGLALTLAGIVGLIVSIGVSADSNIVYFENVREAYRTGRKVPTSIERAYASSISTIFKADIVSLIASVVLYSLTVGAVKQFAFYLGIATLLDLFISMFFMRPTLKLIASLPFVKSKPKLIGMGSRIER